MKWMNLLLVIGASAGMVSTIGCGDSNGDNPVGSSGVTSSSVYVNSYAPHYTVPVGTSYSGDFFLLGKGYRWDYEGPVSGSLSLHIYGTSDGETVDEQETTPVSGWGTAFSEIQTLRSYSLSSGSYQLFPSKEYALAVIGDESTPEVTYRLYEKTKDKIFLRAIQDATGKITEVKDPVFLKVPLVVGDTWRVNPSVNTTLLSSATDSGGELSLTGESIIHVVGKEEILAEGKTVEAVRLDQVAELKGRSTSADGEVMDFTVKILSTLHVRENIGIVANEMKMDMSANATITDAETQTRVTVEMKMTMEQQMSLTNSRLSTAKPLALARREAEELAPVAGKGVFARKYLKEADAILNLAMEVVKQ